MFCILVFFNYHSLLLVFGCVPSFWAFVLQVESKCNLPCDYTHVLAKSRSICPLSIYTTTLSSLIQGSPLTLLSSSLIMMIGLSWSLKDTNCSCASRTPQSPLTPKSGNVCGRRYNSPVVVIREKKGEVKWETWVEDNEVVAYVDSGHIPRDLASTQV